jgi:hypothetical protein
MRIMAERNSLEQEVKKSRNHRQAQLAALAALVTEGNPGASARTPRSPRGIRFFRPIPGSERAAVGQRSSQTTAQRTRAERPWSVTGATKRYLRPQRHCRRSKRENPGPFPGVESLASTTRPLHFLDRGLGAGMLSVALALMRGFAIRVAVSRGKNSCRPAGSNEPSRSFPAQDLSAGTSMGMPPSRPSPSRALLAACGPWLRSKTCCTPRSDSLRSGPDPDGYLVDLLRAYKSLPGSLKSRHDPGSP